MSSCRRLEQSLKVAVGPLPQRAVASHGTPRIERLAQIHDEPLPLVVGEPAIEIDGPTNANRKAEEATRRGAPDLVDRMRRVGDELGGDPNFSADLLQLGE